ncbi:50S ribosomal protein L6 [Candidatus Micrarchaeota archaeon]|nr:50S ribosomal protein L6 [Candidatus Micrarchaeota archaeon]
MVEITDGVNVQVNGTTVTAKGPGGEVKKILSPLVSVKVEGKKIEISSADKALANTVEAILTNMVHGAKSGYKKNLKLLYAHFPITIEVKGKDLTVKNFLGEKMARKTVIIGNTKVEAKGQNVTISGPDKEAVGQTLANIRTAMRIKEKDGRVFQDGIFEVEGE